VFSITFCIFETYQKQKFMKTLFVIFSLFLIVNNVNSQIEYAGYKTPEKKIYFMDMSFNIGNRNYKLTNEGKSIQYETFANEKITYDYNNKVKQIGAIVIQYDFSNRISKIGAVSIIYDYSGRISNIGNSKLNYDYQGRFTGSTGNIE
jgi:hypothetical protein